MYEPEDRLARRRRMLEELSDRCLAATRILEQRLQAAETAEDAACLGAALHRMARGLRQSLALEARLEADARRAEREDLAEVERQQKAGVSRRQAQVRAAVERLIWTEAEGREAEQLISDLEERLDEEALYDAFTADPVETHIQRLCADLGLPDPIPQGDHDVAEGGEARSALSRPASQPPPSVPDSARYGGASGPDHPWRSSA